MLVAMVWLALQASPDTVAAPPRVSSAPWYQAEARVTDQLGVFKRARLVFTLNTLMDEQYRPRSDSTPVWTVRIVETKKPYQGPEETQTKWADSRTCPAVAEALVGFPDFGQVKLLSPSDVVGRSMTPPRPHGASFSVSVVGETQRGEQIYTEFGDVRGAIVGDWFQNSFEALNACASDKEPSFEVTPPASPPGSGPH